LLPLPTLLIILLLISERKPLQEKKKSSSFIPRDIALSFCVVKRTQEHRKAGDPAEVAKECGEFCVFQQHVIYI